MQCLFYVVVARSAVYAGIGRILVWFLCEVFFCVFEIIAGLQLKMVGSPTL